MFTSCAGMGAAMLLLAGRMYSLQPASNAGEDAGKDVCNASAADGGGDATSLSGAAGDGADVALPIFALCLYMASFSLGMGVEQHSLLFKKEKNSSSRARQTVV